MVSASICWQVNFSNMNCNNRPWNSKFDADIKVIWIIHKNEFGSLFGDEQARG